MAVEVVEAVVVEAEVRAVEAAGLPAQGDHQAAIDPMHRPGAAPEADEFPAKHDPLMQSCRLLLEVQSIITYL